MGQKVLPTTKLTERAAYDNFVLCVESFAVVRQSDKSAAYDKIDPKELFVTKLTQKRNFTG